MAKFPGKIRIATGSDADAIAAIYGPIVRDTAISFETEAPTAATIAQRVADTLPNFPWLVAEQDGKIAGYAYASKHRERAAYRWSVDVTVYVHPAFHRMGVGRVLYEALLAILRSQGFHAAYGGITLPNAASVGLHEAVGFRPVGIYKNVGFKLGQWHDVGWWGIEFSDTAQTPDEPKPFSAVQAPI